MSVEEDVARLIDERYRSQYRIVSVNIPAAILEPGMVVASHGLIVVSTIRSVPPAILVNGCYSFAWDEDVPVWHMNDKPFLIVFPKEMLERLEGRNTFRSNRGSGTPPTPATTHVSTGFIPRLLKKAN